MGQANYGSFGSGRFRQGTLTKSGSGQLEIVPHNNVHNDIGGQFGNLNQAGFDPLFYCHHASIDRLWAEWSETTTQDGTIRNPITVNSWMNETYNTEFVDTLGNIVTYTNAEVVDHRKSLEYRYDVHDEILSLNTPTTSALEGKKFYIDSMAADFTYLADFPALATTNTVVEASVDITDERFYGYTSTVASTDPDKLQFRYIKLFIENILPPPGSGMRVDVFLNCPYLSPEIPYTDPHFVTSFSFFDGGEEHDDHESNMLIDLSTTLRELKALDMLPSPETGMTIQFIARTRGNTVAQYSPGKVYVGLVFLKEYLE